MRAFSRLALAVGAVALLAVPAYAQRDGGFGGPGMLLSNKGVQKELKVTDEQAQKLDSLAADLREKMQGQFQSLQRLSKEDRREKMQELNRKTNAEVKTTLTGILKPDQIKRFEQIQLQASGPDAFANPDIQSKLNLTADQKDKIRGIMDEYRSQAGELRQGFQSDREGTMKK